MDLLLDTHTALWWWTGLAKLTPTANAAIVAAHRVSVSAISALEIGIKFRLGKLPMIGDPAVNFPRLMDLHGFHRLDLSEGQALVAGLMPGDHRDPFDRVIAAQALAADLTVVTRDQAFTDFGCKVLW